MFDPTDPTSINDSVTTFFHTSDNIIENLIDTVTFCNNKMASIVYDYYPFEVEIRDNNLYFFIITNRSEKKMLFSSSLNTDFDKLCESLIKCITTDVKKQIPKKFLKAKGFL